MTQLNEEKNSMFMLHPESAISLEQCGRVNRPYMPNYDFGMFINEEHKKYSEYLCDGPCIIHPIRGWLQPADALKLYELSYFSEGDICEFGTGYGLSTSIIAEAVYSSINLRIKCPSESGKGRSLGGGVAEQRFPSPCSRPQESRKDRIKQMIDTVELNAEHITAAKLNLIRLKLDSVINFHTGDAEIICQKFCQIGKKYNFIFIDFNHAYLPTYRITLNLKKLCKKGTLILYHDYNDPNNIDAQLEKEIFSDRIAYGVYSAVHDAMKQIRLQFVGVYGCCGLFRYV
jgi:predicted O-methyltransferase YrrM